MMETRYMQPTAPGGATSPPTADLQRTLTIDVGGTGIKMLAIDGQGQPIGLRARELTPRPGHPGPVMDLLRAMLAGQPAWDRVSVGFPGVVVGGVVRTAANLGTEEWRGFDLQRAIADCTGTPARVINDADLQGYGVIRGAGLELVFTLGTGLGSALYVNGHLVPNLELAHLPFRNGRTYEEAVSDATLARIGPKRWLANVRALIETLEPAFNYDVLHIGGGNARLLEALPPNVVVFDNVAGLLGGVRLWHDDFA
jgi:polyphosphate glucokinase